MVLRAPCSGFQIRDSKRYHEVDDLGELCQWAAALCGNVLAQLLLSITRSRAADEHLPFLSSGASGQSNQSVLELDTRGVLSEPEDASAEVHVVGDFLHPALAEDDVVFGQLVQDEPAAVIVAAYVEREACLVRGIRSRRPAVVRSMLPRLRVLAVTPAACNLAMKPGWANLWLPPQPHRV